MAKRGRGGSAARSAAAKKGWETRRRGGGGSKPKATKATPKTTTARGRARAAEAKARAAVKGGGGSRATRSLLTAQRARDFYKATGTGKKRSRTGGSGGAKPARTTAAKPRRGRSTAKPSAQRPAAKPVAATVKPSTGKPARTDGAAFAARAKKARSTVIRRSINESDRENAMSSSQRRATAPARRFAASNQRQARAERTAAAAAAFYRDYGTPSTFARRPRQSTASSPVFGSKRRGRKRS